MQTKRAQKVLLIGWDAADWRMIHPLMDAGLMPTLERLVDRGVIANLATLDPPLSPMLWTSIATGKTADRHGILGFTEPTPDGQGIRPVLSTSRKVKAMWNILMQTGHKVHVVGWWPSHPAEPLNGVSVSNFFQQARQPVHQPWPLPNGAVHPPELAETLARLRVHPGELTHAHILPFVPHATRMTPDQRQPLQILAKIIADAASVQAAATWVMEHQEWNFMAVYFDAIDHFGHAFMKFHPPRMPGVSEEAFEYYKDVVTGGYRFHDMMLHRLLELAGPDTTVLLISDHGFHSDHLRPRGIPKVPAGPAVEHRNHGIFCMAGPGIRRDARIYGASILDVAPTILNLFGLPVGRDMQGKPLIEALEQPDPVEFIESWEAVEGKAGMHPPDQRLDPWAEQEALDHLVALGYIDPPDDDNQKAIERTVRESKFYLARVYCSTNRYTEALPILETLYTQWPDQQRFALRLAQCYREVGRLTDCRTVLDTVIAQHEEQTPSLYLLQGKLLLSENKPEDALACFQRAEAADDPFPALYQHIGQAYIKLKQWNDAERAFRQALVMDPDSAVSQHGLAVACLGLRRYEEAAEAALRAVGLRYFFPVAHFHLGEALTHLGHHERAAEAFNVCLSQAPGMQEARRCLAELYLNYLNRPEKVGESM